MARVPIVPAAVLFDLGVGEPTARPDAEAGYAACEAATDGEVEEGSVGAGTGATVAKHPDPAPAGRAGSAAPPSEARSWSARRRGQRARDVVEEDGEPIAGNRQPGGRGRDVADREHDPGVRRHERTLSEERAPARAGGERGHGARRAPAHTMWDGDMVFAVGTGQVEPDWVRLAGDGDEGGGRGDPARRPRGDGRARLPAVGPRSRRDEDARGGRARTRRPARSAGSRRRGRRSSSGSAIRTPT